MEKKYNHSDKAIRVRNYIYNFHYYLAWTTYNKKQLFNTKSMINNLAKLLEHLAKEDGITLELLIIKSNYVFMKLSARPKLSGTNAVKGLKGESALQLSKKYLDLKKYKHIWSNTYCMGTIGNIDKNTIKKYLLS